MKIEKGCVIVFRSAGCSLRWAYDTEDIYNFLVSDAGTEEAIRASCWCELAVVGDVYFGNGFTIAIVEDC